MLNTQITRSVVYCCVIDNYDTVFPPVEKTPHVDFILFTNQPTLKVKGWKTVYVDTSEFQTPSMANRYYKFSPPEIITAYKYSMYIDGNIRVISSLAPIFRDFSSSGDAIGLPRHPFRSSLKEEVSRCKELGVLEDPELADKQLQDYAAEGFQDNFGLTENNVILRNHTSSALKDAMNLWWNKLQEHSNRDQLSFSYVRWKTQIPVYVFSWNARQVNPYFYLYRHTKSSFLEKIKVTIKARRFDSTIHRLLYQLWQGVKKWKN
ncbi:Uncharacterised protein [BD1-7 clade bacterium]|uniref:TOD1/MUCI70 glycosyltransferase-like domain-containing protein n=1 Tax=BD1-7 clade bacterium TaxID=2029982 RepID=A0A5S9N1B4_9GAMM|nr:Uncharacterised protein [BD1-7 clade bacterium]CAA0083214.1 Uncharacterised protein [BD1-7 clade bacterium]